MPYYLKSKGKLKGTYIRVGSSNRLASDEIIAELERQRRNISFDAEINFDISYLNWILAHLQVFMKKKQAKNYRKIH